MTLELQRFKHTLRSHAEQKASTIALWGIN